ncbi:unnamed protein product [Litomosoides sigmodontis]|uniref:Exoribonuclease phosphorolytic domain-containing protein n=1 Tax=Litomosoides sigmodontis TaxID=42156 RepID=A0A3P6URX1_LITSI|nr:unnamed protein product [Litomosoides sigmodontis]
MATFSTNERKERPRGDRRSLEFARLMEKAFEATVLMENYPRSQIDVFCELLQPCNGCKKRFISSYAAFPTIFFLLLRQMEVILLHVSMREH